MFDPNSVSWNGGGNTNGSAPKRGKKKQKRRSFGTKGASPRLARSASENESGEDRESSSDDEGSHSHSSSCGCDGASGSGSPAQLELPKGWGARRRDPRVNGADIYVARVTKSGMGSARPCWRCLEWCRWAGVKRVFHWNAEEGRFDVVKVNSAAASLDQYETHADFRLFAGLVSRSVSFSRG